VKNVNCRDRLNNTSLVYVAQEGHLGIVKFLLDHGADINAADNNEMILLYYIRLLIESMWEQLGYY